MTVTLCIPRPPIAPGIPSREPTRIKLRWTTQDARSSHGLGVLLSGRDVFDGVAYRQQRAAFGAWIEAEDLSRVAGALGVPAGELAE